MSKRTRNEPNTSKKRPYQVCNWTLQCNVNNFPKEYLRTEGMIKLTKLIPGFKFVKKRNGQLDVKIYLNDFIKRDSNLGIVFDKSIIKVIFTDCRDDSILIKIIGVKNNLKVFYGFKIVREILGNIKDPKTGEKLNFKLTYSKINTTNIVITWNIPKDILMDLELVKMKYGNICSYQADKIPIMNIKFYNKELTPPNFICLVPRSGKCTIPGLKSLDDVETRMQMVEQLFLDLWDNDNIFNIQTLKDISKEEEDANSDRLHFIKNENYFDLIENVDNVMKKRKPHKYFNKSNYKKTKVGFSQRINSLQFIKTENLPIQGVEFYYKHCKLLDYQNKKF